MTAELERAIDRLRRDVDDLEYGSATLTVVVHQGAATVFEHGTTVKTRAQTAQDQRRANGHR